MVSKPETDAPRFRSEEERAAAITSLAKRLWDERQKDFPRFTRQTWEHGTVFARQAALDHAEYVLTGERKNAKRRPW